MEGVVRRRERYALTDRDVRVARLEVRLVLGQRPRDVRPRRRRRVGEKVNRLAASVSVCSSGSLLTVGLWRTA